MKRLTVQIPRPCHEHWADMQPTGQGQFCASCQKTVVDFTTLSDRELAQRLSQPAGTTCGRFRADQLNRPLMLPSQDAPLGWRRWVGVLAAGLLGWQTAQAQVNQPSPLPHKSAVLDRNTQLTKSVQDTTSAQEPVITGLVSVTAANGGLKPASGVWISFRGTRHGTYTDANGLFRLPIPADLQTAPLTVFISGLGYLTQKISISSFSQKIIVTLEENREVMGEVVIMSKPPLPRRLQLPEIRPLR